MRLALEAVLALEVAFKLEAVLELELVLKLELELDTVLGVEATLDAVADDVKGSSIELAKDRDEEPPPVLGDEEATEDVLAVVGDLDTDVDEGTDSDWVVSMRVKDRETDVEAVEVAAVDDVLSGAAVELSSDDEEPLFEPTAFDDDSCCEFDANDAVLEPKVDEDDDAIDTVAEVDESRSSVGKVILRLEEGLLVLVESAVDVDRIVDGGTAVALDAENVLEDDSISLAANDVDGTSVDDEGTTVDETSGMVLEPALLNNLDVASLSSSRLTLDTVSQVS
ncbi:hypothetical protein AB5N19_12191 [Seiridium cardinale]